MAELFVFAKKTTATYVHMQDAYIVDQQTPGTFDQIGYDAPTSTVFTYTDNSKNFKATSTVLDKCTKQEWNITVAVEGGKGKYTADDNCSALTPNFKLIGSSK